MKGLSDREGDPSVVRHREVAHAAYLDVLHMQIRMVKPGIVTGYHQVVDIAVERDEAGLAVRRRLGSSWITGNSERVVGPAAAAVQPMPDGCLDEVCLASPGCVRDGRHPGVARSSGR